MKNRIIFLVLIFIILLISSSMMIGCTHLRKRLDSAMQAEVEAPSDKFHMVLDIGRPLPPVNELEQLFPGGIHSGYEKPNEYDGIQTSIWESRARSTTCMRVIYEQNGRGWASKEPCYPPSGRRDVEVWIVEMSSIDLKLKEAVFETRLSEWRPATHREAFQFANKHPEVVLEGPVIALGDMVWTTYEYRGCDSCRSMLITRTDHAYMYPWNGELILSTSPAPVDSDRILLVRYIPSR